MSFFRSLVTDLLGAAMPLQYATIPLTNAQIIALPTTGITVTASPGSGYWKKLIGASIKIDSAAGAYGTVNATFSSIQLEYGTTGKWAAGAIFNDSTQSITGMNALFGVGGGAIRISQFPVPYVDIPDPTPYWLSTFSNTSTDFADQLIRVKVDNNGSGVFSGGHANNAGWVKLYYITEAI